jgi:hypothetical protein
MEEQLDAGRQEERLDGVGPHLEKSELHTEDQARSDRLEGDRVDDRFDEGVTDAVAALRARVRRYDTPPFLGTPLLPKTAVKLTTQRPLPPLVSI